MEEESAFEIFGFETSPTKTAIMFIILLTVTITLVRLFYERTIMKKYVPESCLLVLLGLVLGAIIAAITTQGSEDLQKMLTFPPEVFLNLFIPVIIFDATYFLNKNAFFSNFFEIVTYAVVGTLISTFLVAGLLIASKGVMKTDFAVSELFTYSALISAVDPVAVIAIMESMHVNEDLFNLVFGESTLNDGVAIVLFNLFRSIASLNTEAGFTVFLMALAKFLVSVLGAILLAVVISLAFALVSKMTYKIVNTEVLLFLMCAMACYTLADMLLFSGVIAVMTSAMVLIRYSEYNLQRDSIVSFQNVVHMLAQTFEAVLFMNMGMQISFIAHNERSIDWSFALVGIPYTVLARTVGTFVQTAVLNIRREKLARKITWRDCVVLILCGLRGGIAFSLATVWGLPEPKGSQAIFATSCLIIFTVFAYGLSMRHIIVKLRIKTEIPSHSSYDFACKTLAKPIRNVANFMS